AEPLVGGLFLEGLSRLHHRIGISVLGLEIGADLGIRFVAQPEIVVGERASVDLGRVRDFLRNGRRREIVCGCKEQSRERDDGSELGAAKNTSRHSESSSEGKRYSEGRGKCNASKPKVDCQRTSQFSWNRLEVCCEHSVEPETRHHSGARVNIECFEMAGLLRASDARRCCTPLKQFTGNVFGQKRFAEIITLDSAALVLS